MFDIPLVLREDQVRLRIGHSPDYKIIRLKLDDKHMDIAVEDFFRLVQYLNELVDRIKLSTSRKM